MSAWERQVVSVLLQELHACVRINPEHDAETEASEEKQESENQDEGQALGAEEPEQARDVMDTSGDADTTSAPAVESSKRRQRSASPEYVRLICVFPFSAARTRAVLLLT